MTVAKSTAKIAESGPGLLGLVMSIEKKARVLFSFFVFLLTAGLILTQGTKLEAIAMHAGQDNGEAKSTQVATGRFIFGESCIQCHNMNTVLIQRKSEQGWRHTVYSMISRGAQLTPQEIVPLVAYLTATYGPDSPSPVAMSKSKKGTEITDAEHLPAGAGRQVLSRTCVRCHSLSLVTGARKSEVDWETTVARMTSFGAKLSPTDRQTLVQYLGENLSNKK